MPKSRIRKKVAERRRATGSAGPSTGRTGSTSVSATATRGARGVEHMAPSPRWLAPVMLAMFALGILWLSVYYITNGGAPGQEELGPWNIAVGFAFLIVGFGFATRWR